MASTDKAKEFTDTALGKAGEFAEKAGEKAAELFETAREHAPEYLDKAAELASQAVEAAAAGIDKVTGGRYHEQIESISTKVGETLEKARPAEPTVADVPPPPTGTPSATADPVDVPGQAGEPVTPATTTPETEAPGTTAKADEPEPGGNAEAPPTTSKD
ncbi:hypothetical protein WEH80_39690 [Actinomycetes bacterium KLBMP 9759]